MVESNEIMSKPYIQHSDVAPKNNGFPKRRKKEVDEKTIFGNLIKEDEAVTKINSIVGENNDIVIEAKVFGIEEFVPASKAFKILTLKVTDNTDSIICKTFIRDDDIYDSVVKKTKPGKWIKLRGNTKYDEYSNNELVLNVYDIYESDRKDKKMVDDASVKRVELHTHTMMSQMDGVSKIDLDKHTCEIVSNAIDMGYKAVAITDHSGCQAFPIVFELVTGYNKGLIKGLKAKKEELEGKIASEENEDQKKLLNIDLESVNEELEHPKKFKALYGTELTLVDDTVYIGDKVNVQMMTFLYQCVNKGIGVTLLTKHAKDIYDSLKRFKISVDLFDEIVHIEQGDNKAIYIVDKESIFIDDSFAERLNIQRNIGIPVFDLDMIESLIDWRM